VCTADRCAALPGGNGCTTLGDACTVAGDCCSEHCAGGDGVTPGSGTCAPSFTCHAYYDVCFRDEECCSGVCDKTLSDPGRCKQMPGRCTQDGNPCDNDSNCCTRLCLPLGAGTVCQPAAGCRMTGNYCDRVESCCGGSPDGLRPEGYTISCDVAGDHRCTNGTACNPPGNTCGDSSSWNCCDGKKDVCKVDSNGVKRCFGGCPNDDCRSCPAGYDANDPLCCIPAAPDPSLATTANVCQFRDQCCGGAPCVPDANGVLHCIAPANACLRNGETCSGPESMECCAPSTCLPAGGDTFVCGVDTTSCDAVGDPCSGGAAGCCSELCVEGTCVACLPNGGSCAGMTGAQCCSGICQGPAGEEECVAACQGAGGFCTGNLDCCAGTVCNVPLGATSGTCGSQQLCAPVSQPCSDTVPCCNDGYCDPEAGTCQPL
jgi:hypothetical protein